MNDALLFDIETAGTTDPAMIARVRDTVKPPGSYKKPESIAKWWADEGPGAVHEALQRTALDGTYGRIVSFACAVDYGIPVVHCGPDEGSILESISETFSKYHRTLVAFNGEFDVRFIWQRLIVAGIKRPAFLPNPNEKNAWYDPMREWGGYRGYIKQQDLELALGHVRPSDITGADVGDAVLAQDWQTIANHNLLDIQGLQYIYRRMTT
jgi:hypothetical protein